MKHLSKQCYLLCLIAASLTASLLLLVDGHVWSWSETFGKDSDVGVVRGAQRQPRSSITSSELSSRAVWSPFLDIVPSQDGSALYVSAGNMIEVDGGVILHLPTHDKDSWTMTFTPTVQSYVTTVTGFTPGVSESAPLRITSSLGHNSGLTHVQRLHLPASSTETLHSLDGHLAIDLISADTIPCETYIVIVPSFGPPAPPPLAHAFVGSIYSVRAGGALVAADQPMLLRLYYATEILHGFDPHTLAIFVWDADNRHWQNLGGRLFSVQQHLSIPIRRFASYVLMATNAWQDRFDDFSGLDFTAGFENVTVGGSLENRVLRLTNTPGSGVATSVPIHLPSGMQWDALELSGASHPPTTTLRVDVLSEDGRVLLEDVKSVTSLKEIDPETYPNLRLRARMTSSAADASPELAEWRVSWRSRSRIYLPVQLRQNSR